MIDITNARVVSPITLESDIVGLGLNGIVVQWKDIDEKSLIEPFVCAMYKEKSVSFEGDFGEGMFSLRGTLVPHKIPRIALVDAITKERASTISRDRIVCVPYHVYSIMPCCEGGHKVKVDVTMTLLSKG